MKSRLKKHSMNLHRVGQSADWEDIPAEQRNTFQKVAARTRGAITPGNAVSILGMGLVISGAREYTKGNRARGLVLMAAGRVCDNIDGFVADKTGTKSRIGEAVDAVGDKAIAAAVLPMMIDNGTISENVGAAFITKNIVNTASTSIAKKRGAEIHASAAGKQNTFGESATVGLYAAARAASAQGHDHASRYLEIAGHASFAVTTALGIQASWGYFQDALASHSMAAPLEALPLDADLPVSPAAK